MSVQSQIKLVLAEYGPIIAALIAILGAAALGAAGLTYLNPPVKQVTETTSQQSVATGVDTTAIVTNGTALYNEGQKLRNEPVYFSQAAPNLTYHIWTEVPANQSVTVSQRLTLVLTGARDGKVFYESRRVLAATKTNVSDGIIWTNQTVNMSAVRQRVVAKQNAIGTVGTLDVVLKLTVSYRTNKYDNTLNTTTPIIFSERAYWLKSQLSAQKTHSSSITRRVEGKPAMGRVIGFGLVGLALLATAGGVLVRSQRMSPETYEAEVVRSRYDEWISNGEIPTKSEKDYVRTDTLEDLVDVAIDSNSRVIYDRDLETYAVVQGDIVYYYTTSESDLTDWLDV